MTIARNSGVKATTTPSNEIKAILVSADEDLRDAMKVQSLLQLAIRASNLTPVDGQHLAVASLGRRWLQLHAEIVELDTMIRTMVGDRARSLVARPGIGIHSGAQLPLTAGGIPERLRNVAAFAAQCAVSPVRASSGQFHRHRLSRGGDRAANNALWTIANNRLIHDSRARECAARRQTTGDSRNDTLRVLKSATSPGKPSPLSATLAPPRRLSRGRLPSGPKRLGRDHDRALQARMRPGRLTVSPRTAGPGCPTSR